MWGRGEEAAGRSGKAGAHLRVSSNTRTARKKAEKRGSEMDGEKGKGRRSDLSVTKQGRARSADARRRGGNGAKVGEGFLGCLDDRIIVLCPETYA